MAEAQQPWEIRFERQLEQLLIRLSKDHFRLIAMTILALAVLILVSAILKAVMMMILMQRLQLAQDMAE